MESDQPGPPCYDDYCINLDPGPSPITDPDADLDPGSNLRCVNCRVDMRRLRRHPLEIVDVRLVIQQWLLAQQVLVSSEDHVCHSCWTAAWNEIRQPQKASTSLSNHRLLCVSCGGSLQKTRSHLLRSDSPRESGIKNIVARKIAPQRLQNSSHICHPCWQRSNRAAAHTITSTPSSVTSVEPGSVLKTESSVESFQENKPSVTMYTHKKIKTSEHTTPELPSPIDNGKNKCLLEEFIIKHEPINDDEEGKPDVGAGDEEDDKTVHIQNMLVEKAPVPTTEEDVTNTTACQPENEPPSLLRQLLLSKSFPAKSNRNLHVMGKPKEGKTEEYRKYGSGTSTT